jgi:hypothetical protein
VHLECVREVHCQLKTRFKMLIFLNNVTKINDKHLKNWHQVIIYTECRQSQPPLQQTVLTHRVLMSQAPGLHLGCQPYVLASLLAPTRLLVLISDNVCQPEAHTAARRIRYIKIKFNGLVKNRTATFQLVAQCVIQVCYHVLQLSCPYNMA